MATHDVHHSGIRWRSALVLVLSLLLASCGDVPSRERVVFRLDAGSFSGLRSPAHQPVAKIGEQVRQVAYAREQLIDLRFGSLAPRAGFVRAPATLPPAARSLPASAFVLSAGRLPVRPTDGAVEQPGGAGVFTILETGWRLRRHPRRPARAKVVVRAEPGWNYFLRLDAFRPMPATLESEPFDLPARARLELAYGLANPSSAPREARVGFEASIDCPWWWSRVVHRDVLTVGAGAEDRWHEARADFRRGARGCRLVLRANAEHAGDGDPVWAAVRVIAPSEIRQPSDEPSLVLISLDTLRADRLSGYGYGRETSPEIDRLLIERGTTFTDVSTTYPLTHWAHLSLFTSLYPRALPASGTLPADVPVRTLTEALRDAGFWTVGITEDALVGSEYGFGWGFDQLSEHHAAAAERGYRVFDEARRYVREHAGRRMFLFLHTYRVHDPYEPSGPYRALFHEKAAVSPDIAPALRAGSQAYDQGIREADDLVAGFVRELDRLGMADRTLVVLLSDHGEAFGEHGFRGHGLSPYQQNLHVPLVLRGPGVPAGLRVAGVSSLVDVAPTLLELLGVPALHDAQGHSLRDALHGGDVPVRPLFFEWIGAKTPGVRWGTWKFVRDLRPLLFDVLADPGEKDSVQMDSWKAAVEKEALAHLADGERRRSAWQTGGSNGDRMPVSPETERALRALGYLQ